MPGYNLKADLLLLITAVIWGIAFVAQRVGMAHVGPFTFTGIRFALGILVLLPFYFRDKPKDALGAAAENNSTTIFPAKLATGAVIFCAVSLQQIGLVYTTAGKAGFITGLYVVIVPILGLFLRQRTHLGTWLGAFSAAIGLYLLSITDDVSIAFGDLLEFLGAILWAVHVHLIGWLSPKMNSARLAVMQYAICSLLSLAAALLFESITLNGIRQAAGPILYGGILSVGVAYTLQVVAQKEAHPAHAAILLSLETVIAAIAGWALLGETLSLRGIIGCSLMLSGMLISQLYDFVVRVWISGRQRD